MRNMVPSCVPDQNSSNVWKSNQLKTASKRPIKYSITKIVKYWEANKRGIQVLFSCSEAESYLTAFDLYIKVNLKMQKIPQGVNSIKRRHCIAQNGSLS